MRASAFWKAVTMDEADLLGKLLALLKKRGIRFCIIGGQGVNAYAEAVVSLDLDVVVAGDQLAGFEASLAGYRVERFPHGLYVSLPGSDLRVQIQTDPRYAPFVERATSHEVLGHTLPVAAVEDVLQGKVWAASDKSRRASKRQKDLADVARLIEAHPHLRERVPADLLNRLVQAPGLPRRRASRAALSAHPDPPTRLRSAARMPHPAAASSWPDPFYGARFLKRYNGGSWSSRASSTASRG